MMWLQVPLSVGAWSQLELLNQLGLSLQNQ